MICIQLKIKCKIILLKTLEDELNKSYFMTYQTQLTLLVSILGLCMLCQCHALTKLMSIVQID
jgi:hypothetical protein